MKIVVFDTETSGLPTEKNASIYHTNKWPHILQLSYIVYDTDNNTIVTVEDDYINIDDDVKIDPKSTEVHKITKEQLKNGIPIQEALVKFNRYANDCTLIIGHNVSFDKRMVFVEGIRNKIKMNIQDTYCTMKNSTEICKIERTGKDGEKYYKYPTLTELYKHLFTITPKNTHNALVDILLCLQCFCKIELNINIAEKNRTIRYMIKDSIH